MIMRQMKPRGSRRADSAADDLVTAKVLAERPDIQVDRHDLRSPSAATPLKHHEVADHVEVADLISSRLIAATSLKPRLHSTVRRSADVLRSFLLRPQSNAVPLRCATAGIRELSTIK